MKKIAGYKVEHETMTIVCSKAFLKKASKVGTDEYKALLKARHDFPDYDTVTNEPKRAEAKMSMKGLTSEFMELYIIKNYGLESQDYTSYQGMKAICDDTKNSYMTMRTWFTKKYPNWDGKDAERQDYRRQKATEKQNQAKLTLSRLNNAEVSSTDAAIGQS